MGRRDTEVEEWYTVAPGERKRRVTDYGTKVEEVETSLPRGDLSGGYRVKCSVREERREGRCRDVR